MTDRTLVLLRHAKAERPGSLADVNRSLTDRGHADAGAAGAWLAARGYIPGVVICSPAKRTRQTWHEVALALTAAPTVHYEKLAYTGGAQDLFRLVSALGDETATVLVIGHNPAVSELSMMLDPSGAPGDSDGLRTCGLAVHQAPAAWAQWSARSAPLVASHTARG